MGSFLPLILLYSFGNLLLVVQGDHHSHLATKLQVSEHGIHYNETLSLNPDEQVVTVHVPAHHDLDEHFTAMHEPSVIINKTFQDLYIIQKHYTG